MTEISINTNKNFAAKLPMTIVILPVVLIIVYLTNRPFSNELAGTRIKTQDLSVAQKFNIEKASKKLDGIIVLPGQLFSFNGCVGPRTPAQGYLDAPSYIGGESPSTAGGGICVVSSALYQTVLASNLPVKERVAHLRVMQTVKPGLDATVWYGGADLKFINSYSKPVEILCQTNESTETLTVKLMSESRLDDSTKSNQEMVTRSTLGANHTLSVEVYRHQGKELSLISRDLYGLTLKTPASSKRNNARDQ